MDSLYIAWQYVTWNRGKTLVLITSITLITFLPIALQVLLNESEASMLKLLGRFLCWLGFHDYRVVNVTYQFGTGGVEKDECRRCGTTRTRIAS